MRKYKIKSKKNMFLLCLFGFFSLCIFSLTVGFCASSSTLSVDGSVLVRGAGDVRVTNVQRVNASDDVDLKDLHLETDSTFSLDCKLKTIWSKVSFEITVVNLSSTDVVVTDINELVTLNTHMEYVLSGLEINKTRIPAASEFKFTITFQYKGGFIDKYVSGSFEIIEQWMNPETSHLKTEMHVAFHKLPQYKYTIVATPNDATITVESLGKVVATGTGTVTVPISEGSDATWTVSKDRYYTQTGVDVVTAEVYKNVELVERTEFTYTVSPTPTDALVTIKKKDGKVLVSGTGTQSVTIDDLTELSYTVSKFEYYDKSGDFTLNGADYTENVSLEMMPWVTGTFVNTDRKVATTKEDTVYHPGYYLIEMWGGKGGEYYRASSQKAGYRGEAGYIYAVVNLDYNQKIYFTLGGNSRNGEASGSSRGGANGGGYGAQTYPGGGGGYSAFAIDTTSISEATINSGNVLMIVGGGGGGSGSSLVAGKPGDGGDGGNMNSTSTVITIGTVFHGEDGTLNQAKKGKNGLGGTYVARANSGAGKAGTLLAGGDGTGNGGGGGGGYFGGGGGGGAGTLSSNQAGGAGGGSSLISNKCFFTGLSASTTAKLVGANPSSSGGAIVITYLGSSY